MPNGKSVGVDSIPYEVFKYGSDKLLDVFTGFINRCVEEKSFPEEFMHGRIFLIYKKGNPYVVGNYRPITLLNCGYKLFTAALNARLVPIVENCNLISNNQGGFRKHRSCINKIRTIINAIDDASINGQSIHTLAVDFEKAFDSVSHDALYRVLKHKGIPQQVIDIIAAIYNNSYSDVITGQGVTKKFKVEKGVRQGDVLSPLLFGLFIDCVAAAIDSIDVGYHFRDNVLVKVACALFADDLILVASNHEDIQKLIDVALHALRGSGLKINASKTIYAHNSPGIKNYKPVVVINGVVVLSSGTKPFRYLGAHIGLNGLNTAHFEHVVAEVDNRINKLCCKGLTVQHAVRCINVIILPIITYSSELFSWKQCQLDTLDKMVYNGLKQIAGIKRKGMGVQFVFAPTYNGGLGVTQPSVAIATDAIYGLFKAINVNRDSLEADTTNSLLYNLQLSKERCVHPVEDPSGYRYLRKTYLTFALAWMDKLGVKFVDNSKTFDVDYCLSAALSDTKYQHRLYALQSSGIFKLSQLPSASASKHVLDLFIDKYLMFKNINVPELRSIIDIANTNKCKKVIPGRSRLLETPCNLIPSDWNEVTIYTDGGYIKDNNIAAFGLTVENPEFDDERRYNSMSECSRIPGKQDNYRAEMFAILRALKNCHNNQIVTVRSDSKSGIDAIMKYLNCSLEAKLKYSNRGLLDCICREIKRIKKVNLEHVYGHTGIDGNEAADSLATKALSHDNIAICVHVGESIKYTISQDGDSICKSPRDFIKEIATAYKVKGAEYKYNLLHNNYPPISHNVWCDTSMQGFLTKARSNQLATNSKMKKWGNNSVSSTCTRCNKKAHEDQLHVFCECDDNTSILNSTFKNVHKVMQEWDHCKGITKPLQVPGLPFAVYNQYRLKIAKNQEHKFTSYRWIMGLVKVQDIDELAKAGYDKPVKLASKLLRIITGMAKEIWQRRNIKRVMVATNVINK